MCMLCGKTGQVKEKGFLNLFELLTPMNCDQEQKNEIVWDISLCQ